jgi:pseudouridine-5'-phosphate glycosidase
VIRLSAEVEAALEAHGPVVALETTLVAHGFPPGVGLEVGLAAEQELRAAGATPASVGVLDGSVVVGLSAAELSRFDQTALKAGPRDLAAAAVSGSVGATTVGGTLVACRQAGLRFMATGGLGGVHRGWPQPPDVSADLELIARTPVLLTSAGVKSILDVAATGELLETLGVPVLGWRSEEMPRFYSAGGGPPVSARVEDAAQAARIASAHWRLGGGGLLLTRAPDESLEQVEALISEALAEADARGIHGKAITPFVLGRLNELSGGETQRVNRALVLGNARLAGEVAVAAAAG